MGSGLKIQVGPHEFDLSHPIDISIPMRFNGPQPNAYGVDPAVAAACEYGDLIGDTRRGGSCNFERVTLIPHCNGTHTECVGHITDERISITDCLKDTLAEAALITVLPEETPDGEQLITRESLANLAGALTRELAASRALIVRTLPNDDSKLIRTYDEATIPPYFTLDAMKYIVDCGFRHLLVDMPSIDRIFDEGKLLNHCMFWGVAPGGRETDASSHIYNTITEMIYVPNEVSDGDYLLNLQIAPFVLDAAPSRPVLFREGLPQMDADKHRWEAEK